MGETMTEPTCPICGHTHPAGDRLCLGDSGDGCDSGCPSRAYRWALRVLPFVQHTPECDVNWCGYIHAGLDFDDYRCNRHKSNWFAHPSHHTHEPRPCTCGLADAMGVGV